MSLKYLFISLSALFIFSLTGYGQITIGSEEEPAPGALLQLKTLTDQTSGGGANATKGLAMPRVSMLTTTPAATQLAQSIGGSGVWDANAHVGLMVYNINECVIDGQRGLYVWNGSRWQLLDEPSTDIQLFQDQEQKEFRARQFGNAGIWMLENLAVKSFANGTPINQHAGVSSFTDPKYAYPNSTRNNWSVVPSTWNRKQGLLYNWMAATNSYVLTNINQAQISGEIPGTSEVENKGTAGIAPNKYVQGVCPNGWHLPSDREWNILEREIANNPTKYSVRTATSWNNGTITGAIPATDWALFTGYRGNTGMGAGHGASMKVKCPPTGSSTVTGGQSYIPVEGGFAALLTGDVVDNNIFSYGANAYFWTSSVIDTGTTTQRGWARIMQNDNAGVQRNNLNQYFLVSVRCKKNADLTK